MRPHRTASPDGAAEPPPRPQDGRSLAPRGAPPRRARLSGSRRLSAARAGTEAQPALSSRSSAESPRDDREEGPPAAPPQAEEDVPEGRSSRRRKLARELVLELHVLRGALEEALPVFLTRVQAQLTQVTRRLEAGVADSGAALPSAGALGLALREVRGARVKPRKGRAKDITRIGRVAERLAQLDAGE